MEWKVIGKIPSIRNDLQILKVSASGNLKFVVWVKSNLEMAVGDTLTPVIEGYIANHNKGHFLVIQKAVPFTIKEWDSMKEKQNLYSAESKVIT